MSLHRKEFEELADIIATAEMMGDEHIRDYFRARILHFCKEHGHNFNEKLFLKRINELSTQLNNG